MGIKTEADSDDGVGIKTEADSDDGLGINTQFSHDDVPCTGMSGFSCV